MFERHLGLIHRFIVVRVGAGDADDLTAEVFLIAYRRRADFDGLRGDTRGWLLGIALNVLRNHRRGRRRMLAMVRRLSPETAPDRTAEINARVDAQAAGARLNAALDSLRADERDVFLLTAWGELGHQEIALALGIPIGTVKSRLSRARTKLQARLAEAGQPSPVELTGGTET
ncbi:MAG: RNA polymerase sigma factor [Thermoleophilia bacterium]|nr:RNA polymerase sigma factor [Thermoleophilia bacterium]